MKKSTPDKKEIRFTSILERSTNKLWGSHFRVPTNVAKKLMDGTSRRVVCTLNNSATYQCAMLPQKGGVFVISVNRQLCKKLKLDYGTDVQVSLKKDESEYGLPLPEELEEVFRQDSSGSRLFHALTRGKQRTLLYIVDKGKNPDVRIFRALTIVKHLASNKGKINYRQLSQTLKNLPR
jgi:hypothetical protein